MKNKKSSRKSFFFFNSFLVTEVYHVPLVFKFFQTNEEKFSFATHDTNMPV